MPFKSVAQRAFMHIHHPGIAKRWERETPSEKLPGHVRDDLLPGGKGDGHSPSEFDRREVAMGLHHEMEHTDDPRKALEIAIDHLTENPHYYTELRASGIESEAVSLPEFFP